MQVAVEALDLMVEELQEVLEVVDQEELVVVGQHLGQLI
jgi:uncharacterized protein